MTALVPACSVGCGFPTAAVLDAKTLRPVRLHGAETVLLAGCLYVRGTPAADADGLTLVRFPCGSAAWAADPVLEDALAASA